MEEDEADAKDVTFARRGRDEFRLPVVSFRARVTRYRKVNYLLCTTSVIILYRCNFEPPIRPPHHVNLISPSGLVHVGRSQDFVSAASKVQKHR
jgi:hypothetical protein